ncbi:ADP-heptose:LPS heptosyltransferase [Salegentibacter sp. 24]|jgi:ADP-heptose:LPS heptosyltransferase|uniref:glycosyltransferase family 9 protein n=1 Tax=Salegentibacter sp. 24 TaxID=2183986 RepID=UPI00105BB5B2|nr:glycosyltransferase family 9 protein [Salegentibacter sp. 24]TDN87417.1 ADP-heptose:LPS heptosyltransferase [Salegentibacter sp. 24]
MNIKKLNSVKTRIFKFLTGSYQNTRSPKVNFDSNSSVKILIARPNHRLGNQLLVTPLIQEFKKRFPQCRIDLVVNGNLGLVLFSEYDYIGKIYNLPKKPFNNILLYVNRAVSMMTTKYDIAIAGNEKSNSSKIFVKLSRSKNKIYNSDAMDAYKPRHNSKIPIYNLLKFLDPSMDLKDYEYPKLSVKLTPNEVEQGKSIVRKLFNNENETICIYTYATAKKCHAKEWWLDFYEKLKTEFKGHNILEILPIENVSQIDFKSVHFYSKDLREIASIIENCTIFIGADSGIMHLSVSTNTTTIGLFNVTDPEIYGPLRNKNGWVDTNTLNFDEIIDRLKIAIYPGNTNTDYISRA